LNDRVVAPVGIKKLIPNHTRGGEFPGQKWPTTLTAESIQSYLIGIGSRRQDHPDVDDGVTPGDLTSAIDARQLLRHEH
jgi:hypothetical protein